ncbi:adenylate kinase 7 isoform X2 [Lasioglossum baleicum]
MTVNLNVESDYIADKITWHHDAPFHQNIDVITNEYRTARKLYPLKIIVLGPPASGKSIVARYLADYYGVHYIHAKSLIEETVRKLTVEIEEAMTARERVTAEETGAGDEAEDEDEDEDEDLEGEDDATRVDKLRELLDEIERNKERNKGRLDDPLLNKLFERKLRSLECQNQGYVMDGYPKTIEQTKKLFGRETGEDVDVDEEEEDFDEEAIDMNEQYTIMPDLVVSLEASDGFLKERIIQRPEWEIQDTHYTAKHMIRRLKEFRKRNTDENTPLQFFDEIEIHPLIIPIEEDVCPEMFPTIYQCLEKLGPPPDYGATAEMARSLRQRAEMEARTAKSLAEQQAERELLERKRQREEKMAEWTELMEKLKEDEEERLCLRGLPLRHYLVKYIFPTLTQGLIEVANLRPDDPIDFLAEYLFKENPEGKMFHPEYTRTMRSVLDAIEKFEDFVLPRDEFDEKVRNFLKQRSDHPDGDRTSETSDSDVCGGKTEPCITPCFRYDDTISIEGEGEGYSESRSDRLTDPDLDYVFCVGKGVPCPSNSTQFHH